MTDRINLKDVTFSEDEVLCPLPFNHMNWHPNGHVSVCCVAEMFPPNDGFYRDSANIMMNLKNTSVEKLWSDSSINTIRKTMLEGNRPLPCQNCYKIEETGGISRRQREIQRWGTPKTSKLQFIDLRMSNLCNSKCMMCYPDSSSALIREYKQWQNALEFVPANSTDYELFQWFDEQKIEELLEFKDQLKYLYINGGEPFIMDMHWKFLERLIEEDVAKNIQISYNTNCSVHKPEFHDIWKEFKYVTLGLSVDAVDEKNKWIRSPINSWQNINENIVKLINTPSLSHVNITCTIQWLNLPYMDEFYDWTAFVASSVDDKPITINQNFLTFPAYLSINAAPISFKQRILAEFRQSKNKDLILSDNMKAYLSASEEDHDLWKKGHLFMEEVSKTRGVYWRDIFKYDY